MAARSLTPKKRPAPRAGRRSWPARVGGGLLRVAVAAALLWVAGFVLFIATLPGPAAATATDGVVVLTGGPGRLARGADVLERGLAKRMLVSGVANGVRPQELAATVDAPRRLFRCCVDLGFVAADTRGNAQEAAAWVAQHRYRSVRLVTAAYHVPRARLELHERLGEGVRIVADGVPAGLPPAALALEYMKYIARGAMLLLGAP